MRLQGRIPFVYTYQPMQIASCNLQLLVVNASETRYHIDNANN